MDCSKRLFVLYEKHGNRYISAVNRETTAKAIVEERVKQGYWYDGNVLIQIERLSHLESTTFPYYKFLRRRVDYEYENFDEVYIEELV